MGAEMLRCRYRGQRVLVCTSVLGILSAWSLPTQAQDAQTLDTITITTIGRTAARPRAGSSPAVAPVQAPQQQQAAPQQISAPQEAAIDTLAPVSVITLNTINTVSAKRISDIFYNVPGVSFTDRGDSPANSVNIRGLQDFGRVAVVVDGARQNYQVTGHNANGAFFLDPALVGGVEVVRGPTANVYGSGAIGGLVAFRTKDADDILKPGERFATEFSGMAGSNSNRGLGTAFIAGKPNQNIDYIFGGTYRTQGDYKGGDDILISNTANRVGTGLAKVTVRPLDGHEFKFGGLFQENNYNAGQFNRGPIDTASLEAVNQGTSVFDTQVKNYQANARWKYYRPEDKLFNWDANIYWNRTEQGQTKIYDPHPAGLALGPSTIYYAPCFQTPGNAISGCVGDNRGYNIDTKGFNVNNTSRFDAFGFSNALTIGGDGFQDDVSTFDAQGNSNVTTPGGVRSVTGAFAQLKSNFSNWLEIVSAVRYDNYELTSGPNSSGGDRVSPKITVGVTPIQGFTPYVSYAEGYRAPSITETLLVGPHIGPNPYAGLFYCPSGTYPPPGPPVFNLNLFCFLPNLNLRPEVGKNKEAGVNLKYNDIFGAGDSFRGKFNVFRNDLEDYIELTQFGPTRTYQGIAYYPFYQYQNIQSAHIQGFEAETMYDAGAWFVGVSVTLLRGYNDVTGIGLATIPGNKIVTSGGVRLLDRKMTIGASWSSVASNQNVPVNYLPATSYDLLNLYLSYEPVKDLWVNFTVDNALNRYYRPYAIPKASPTEVQNDTLWASVPPGIVYKGTVRMRFSAM
jgi:hemoglobin/transferrin/lactoferrin receptor protein